MVGAHVAVVTRLKTVHGNGVALFKRGDRQAVWLAPFIEAFDRGDVRGEGYSYDLRQACDEGDIGSAVRRTLELVRDRRYQKLRATIEAELYSRPLLQADDLAAIARRYEICPAVQTLTCRCPLANVLLRLLSYADEALPADVTLCRSWSQREDAMAKWARLTRVKGDSGRYDEAAKMVEENVLPSARNLQGFAGGIWFGNRETGEVSGLTLFESKEALEASEAGAQQIRERAAGALGGEVIEVERFEVFLEV